MYNYQIQFFFFFFFCRITIFGKCLCKIDETVISVKSHDNKKNSAELFTVVCTKFTKIRLLQEEVPAVFIELYLLFFLKYCLFIELYQLLFYRTVWAFFFIKVLAVSLSNCTTCLFIYLLFIVPDSASRKK